MTDQVADVEIRTLGAMLLSSTAVTEVIERGAVADDFADDRHAWIFDAITSNRKAGIPTEPTAVAATLSERKQLQRIDGGTAYLHTCLAAAPTAVGWYVGELLRYAEIRAAVRDATWLHHSAKTDDLDQVAAIRARLVERWKTDRTARARFAGLRDGAWLDEQEFPPLRYAVPGILPEGSTLLVGPPKIGKSWAVLDILLALAAGGRALGAIPIEEPRPVLYLALEDGDRRLQDRCRKLLRGEPIPRNFNYLTRVPPGGVVEVIAEWTDRNPDAAAVVLDTLGKVMPPAAKGESAYQRDYRVAGRLKLLVDERPGLALLTNHHDRKAESSDFVDSVSGTHGLAGAADTIIVLTRPRKEQEGTLKITGRDVVEGEYAVVLEEGTSWNLFGGNLDAAAERVRDGQDDAKLARRSDRSAEIVDVIKAAGTEGIRAAELAAKFGDGIHAYLQRLVKADLIVKASRGLYVASVRSVSTADPQVNAPNSGPSADGRVLDFRRPVRSSVSNQTAAEQGERARSDTSNTSNTGSWTPGLWPEDEAGRWLEPPEEPA